MNKNNDSLTCVLDRYENSHAVLIFNITSNNHPELQLPKRYLPKNVQEGDILHVKIHSDKVATLNQKEIAQHILNEILNNNK